MAFNGKRPLCCDIVVGTRPEAIKLAPVAIALQQQPERFSARIVTSGQHGEICRSALGAFGLTADIALELEAMDRSLAGLAGNALRLFGRHVAESPPDLFVVQGDTTTAMAAALAGFYAKIPIVHVEAGLRSGDLANPFPEEANRKVIDAVSTILLPPTPAAQENLLRAGFDAQRCPVTGNTVVDALQMLCSAYPPVLDGSGIGEDELEGRRLIIVTTHRRESWGAGIEAICGAVRDIAERHKEYLLIALPVHPNPNVSGSVRRLLGGHPCIKLLPPLDYLAFLSLMRRAYLIVTDSGGIQEEAPSLGVPVLVIRKTTERPEAAEAGLARVIGTDPIAIVEHTEELLNNRQKHRLMVAGVNPFGDGRASERIAEVLRNWADGCALLPADRSFMPPACPSLPCASAGAIRRQQATRTSYQGENRR
jgi:UDP-N-acetylglucosamine 2-epimerase (non-hydrolysing)